MSYRTTTFLPTLASDRRVTPIADPELTPLGEQQAQEVHAAWEKERQIEIPLPGKLYTSPLTRAIRTNQVTFDETVLPSGPKTTTIVEVSPARWHPSAVVSSLMLMSCMLVHNWICI